MPNICKPDCGWDPDARKAFKIVTAQDLKSDAFDLAGITCMEVDLQAESANVQIQDFVNMEQGKEYTLVAYNGSGKQLQVLFPDGTTYHNAEIIPANGMRIVYKFFTDGKAIFVNQQIYS